MPILGQRGSLPLRIRADSAFALDGRNFIVASEFRDGVEQLAGRLPPANGFANLCGNRLRFIRAFAAAVLRGQTTLLPASHAPSAVAEMMAEHPDCGILDDSMSTIEPAARRPATLEPAADFIAAIAHTSGSTGRPTAHLKLWGELCACHRAERCSNPRGHWWIRHCGATVDRGDRSTPAHVRARDFGAVAVAGRIRHSLGTTVTASRCRDRACSRAAATDTGEHPGSSARPDGVRGIFPTRCSGRIGNCAIAQKYCPKHRVASSGLATRNVRLDRNLRCSHTSYRGAEVLETVSWR